MLFNVEFLIQNAKNIKCLYLYGRLRMSGEGKAGYFDASIMTRNEKYKILPKLQRLGWATDKKVIAHRTISNRSCSTRIMVKLSPKDFSSLDVFKGCVLAVAESYKLRFNYKLQNNRSREYSIRDKTFFKRQPEYDRLKSDILPEDQYKVKKLNAESYSGRIGNSNLSRLLEVSERTISRWRKHSKNEYQYSSKHFPVGAREILDSNGIGYFYSKHTKSLVVRDLVVGSSYQTFTTRYTKPRWVVIIPGSGGHHTITRQN